MFKTARFELIMYHRPSSMIENTSKMIFKQTLSKNIG